MLTANPNSTFSHWSGDASGNANPIPVTMNSNKNVTANFTTGKVRLYLAPASVNTAVNSLFTLDVMLETGAQPVNSVELYLTFNPALVRIVDTSGNPASAIDSDLNNLTTPLINTANNSTGQIRYDAGRLTGAPPTGTFRVATIRFKALAETSGTPVSFVAATDVFYQGTSVLGAREGCNVQVVSQCLTGKAALQSHTSPAGHPVRLSRFTPGGAIPLASYNAVLDANGGFTVCNIPGGVFDFQLKGAHSLSVRRTNMSVPSGASIDFCTLLEGDASDDDRISGVDFSLVATAYNKQSGETGFDARTDFNDDGRISGVDFSLLATNYNRTGPLPCPALAAAGDTATESAGAVNLTFSPASQTAQVGDIVTFDMQVTAGTQPVNNVELYVDFDPAVLQLVNAAGNPAASIEADLATLNTELANTVDNAGGHIRYDAGKLTGAPPTGTFRIAVLRFKVLSATASTTVRFVTPSDVFYQGVPVVGALGSTSILGPTPEPDQRSYSPLIITH